MGYNPGQLATFQPSIRIVAGAADTPGVADNGGIVRCTSAAAVTITAPTNAVLPILTPGYNVNYVGEGAGLLSVAVGGGDSLYGYGTAGYFNASPHAAAGQGAVLSLILMFQDPVSGARTWALTGALA